LLPLNTYDPEGSLWLLDKPLTWTSFDVVNKVRNILRQKVGHAGTLDPLASGLLILGSGRGTRLMDQVMGQDKEYTGTLRLGQTTPSADRETPVDNLRPWEHLSQPDIRAAAAELTGTIQQRPPRFSAVRIDGKRAYQLARKGKRPEVEPEPRPVTVHAFDITAIEGPDVSFRVACGKGTYIRSLARDLGEALGCGAHLTSLIRTRIGDYHLADALTIEQMVELGKVLRQPVDRELAVYDRQTNVLIRRENINHVPLLALTRAFEPDPADFLMLDCYEVTEKEAGLLKAEGAELPVTDVSHYRYFVECTQSAPEGGKMAFE